MSRSAQRAALKALMKAAKATGSTVFSVSYGDRMFTAAVRQKAVTELLAVWNKTMQDLPPPDGDVTMAAENVLLTSVQASDEDRSGDMATIAAIAWLAHNDPEIQAAINPTRVHVEITRMDGGHRFTMVAHGDLARRTTN